MVEVCSNRAPPHTGAPRKEQSVQVCAGHCSGHILPKITPFVTPGAFLFPSLWRCRAGTCSSCLFLPGWSCRSPAEGTLGGSRPHSSSAERRQCPWLGEPSVAQGTALHRPCATLPGASLTDIAVSRVPASCGTSRDNPC